MEMEVQECVQDNCVYQHVTKDTRDRIYIPTMLDVAFTCSYLEKESIIFGVPLEKSDHIEPEVEHMMRQEVAKDEEETQTRRTYKEVYKN